MKQVSEAINGLPRELRKALQEFDDLLSGYKGGFFEEHAGRQISVFHVHGRFWGNERVDYCAVLRSVEPLNDFELSAVIREQEMYLEAEYLHVPNVQKPMLVDVPQLVEDVQGVPLVVISGLERLQTLDECRGSFTDTVNHGETSTLIMRFLMRNGEPRERSASFEFVWPKASSDEQIPDNIVKTRTEMGDNLADFQREANEDIRRQVDSDSALARIQVVVFSNAIKLFAPRLLDRRLQISELLLSPFKFGQASFHRIEQ